MEDLLTISSIYSYLGYKVLNGDIETLKYIYGNAWKDNPPMLKCISLLQEALTSVEILDITNDKYSDEFIYYWGMLCIGEQSKLITKNLETAKCCFEKIKNKIPKSNARLAYISLLQSNDVAKSDKNAINLDTLRKYSSQGDLFSRIVLAKIIFHSYLCNNPSETINMPQNVANLLLIPCEKGHPVAIRFFNEILTFIGYSAVDFKKSEDSIKNSSLYDY